MWCLLGAGIAACGGRDIERPALPGGTEVGQLAPSLAGQLPDGTPFVRERGPGPLTVLILYRGSECGLCRVQLEKLQATLPAYERLGAQVVGMTLDPPEASARFAEAERLTFPLVSVDTALFHDWGALPLGASVPLPASYVLDESGIVRFRHIGRNAGDRTSDAELIAVLDRFAVR